MIVIGEYHHQQQEPSTYGKNAKIQKKKMKKKIESDK